LQQSGLDRFVRKSYALLGLCSFFTAAEKEARAWTIPRGTSALHATGVIHSDLARGFIRAEVIHYDDLVANGLVAKARETGKLHLEGKEYLVQDGDVLLIRFHV
jgi:ribosome-binding ATPase YchF (GTP1/OBG family)